MARYILTETHKLVEELERKIIRKLAEDLIAAGFLISVNDDDTGQGDTVLRDSSDVEAILGVMFTTDGDLLIVRTIANHFHKGWVRLIHGNGCDVISDYTVNLEPYMAGANALAEQYQ